MMRSALVAIIITALFTAPCRADQLTQKLLDRLAEEASTFEHLAPSLISEETLRQRAQKIGKSRFRPRIESAQPVAGAELQTREIRSEYAYAMVGDPAALREIRKVLSVDGRTVNTSENAIRELLRILRANDDKSRRKGLEDFEKHGLVGTVTDFGQLLLLFTRANQQQYEFSPKGEQLLGAERCVVFSYKQHDGPGALTIWDAKARLQPMVAGEIWVARESFRIVRITMKSARGGNTGSAIREDAQVDYTMSSHGVVVPVAVAHREYRNGQLAAENLFSYEPFRRFGASADIKFIEAPKP